VVKILIRENLRSNMATRYEKLVAAAKKNITEISPTDAELKLKSSDVVIVDVREKGEWDATLGRGFGSVGAV
jgi:hypothetical protein